MQLYNLHPVDGLCLESIYSKTVNNQSSIYFALNPDRHKSVFPQLVLEFTKCCTGILHLVSRISYYIQVLLETNATQVLKVSTLNQRLIVYGDLPEEG